MFKIVAIDKFNVKHLCLRNSYAEALEFCFTFIKANPHATSVKILDRVKETTVKVIR